MFSTFLFLQGAVWPRGWPPGCYILLSDPPRALGFQETSFGTSLAFRIPEEPAGGGVWCGLAQGEPK